MTIELPAMPRLTPTESAPFDATPAPSSTAIATTKPIRAKAKRTPSTYDPSDPDILQSLIVANFTAIVDTREQAPYRFTGITDDKTGQDIIVPLRHVALKSGDYSIVGLEDLIAVERKSLKDFYMSISAERERFEREIARLYETQRFALVVIEGDWNELMQPESFCKVSPKTAVRTIQSWSIRYPTVHWKWLPNRRVAEVYTYRQLEMFWRIWKHEEDERKKATAIQSERIGGPEHIGDIFPGLLELRGINLT